MMTIYIHLQRLWRVNVEHHLKGRSDTQSYSNCHSSENGLHSCLESSHILLISSVTCTHTQTQMQGWHLKAQWRGITEQKMGGVIRLPACPIADTSDHCVTVWHTHTPEHRVTLCEIENECVGEWLSKGAVASPPLLLLTYNLLTQILVSYSLRFCCNISAPGQWQCPHLFPLTYTQTHTHSPSSKQASIIHSQHSLVKRHARFHFLVHQAGLAHTLLNTHLLLLWPHRNILEWIIYT